MVYGPELAGGVRSPTLAEDAIFTGNGGPWNWALQAGSEFTETALKPFMRQASRVSPDIAVLHAALPVADKVVKITENHSLREVLKSGFETETEFRGRGTVILIKESRKNKNNLGILKLAKHGNGLNCTWR